MAEMTVRINAQKSQQKGSAKYLDIHRCFNRILLPFVIASYPPDGGTPAGRMAHGALLHFASTVYKPTKRR